MKKGKMKRIKELSRQNVSKRLKIISFIDTVPQLLHSLNAVCRSQNPQSSKYELKVVSMKNIPTKMCDNSVLSEDKNVKSFTKWCEGSIYLYQNYMRKLKEEEYYRKSRSTTERRHYHCKSKLENQAEAIHCAEAIESPDKFLSMFNGRQGLYHRSK
ncbi:hypothetical protein BDB01DRAFT_850995 [Pilobolus umbonatus]|nr:hypothetical protein BDB01DRAFT_850995 [Pilobolus umbonatus]